MNCIRSRLRKIGLTYIISDAPFSSAPVGIPSRTMRTIDRAEGNVPYLLLCDRRPIGVVDSIFAGTQPSSGWSQLLKMNREKGVAGH